MITGANIRDIKKVKLGANVEREEEEVEVVAPAAPSFVLSQTEKWGAWQERQQQHFAVWPGNTFGDCRNRQAGTMSVN